MLLRTSSLVSAISVSPFTRTAWRTCTKSNHPMRLGLPVVVPYSPPFSRIWSPVSSSSSVGRGLSPTLLKYAFTTPIVLFTDLKLTPVPIDI